MLVSDQSESWIWTVLTRSKITVEKRVRNFIRGSWVEVGPERLANLPSLWFLYAKLFRINWPRVSSMLKPPKHQCLYQRALNHRVGFLAQGHVSSNLFKTAELIIDSRPSRPFLANKPIGSPISSYFFVIRKEDLWHGSYGRFLHADSPVVS